MQFEERVRWVGVEHMPDLPLDGPHSEDLQMGLQNEVKQVNIRAPELCIQLPTLRPNSRLALAALAAVEDDYPEKSATLRTQLFRALWLSDGPTFTTLHLDTLLGTLQLPSTAELTLPFGLVQKQTTFWRTQKIDRIPALISATGQSHLGLGTFDSIQRFMRSALFSTQSDAGCQ